MAEVTFENEKYIISILKEIEYGSVTITLHAGKIAQIEREEKIRIQTDNPKKG
ncbi:YezD family protein [Niallia taxi]|nr:YezD family protein [Niallia taxi]MDE5051615.1 YezD family protein [Niallia taxi]WOD61960.1 YezD family protein [Niallia taxi]